MHAHTYYIHNTHTHAHTYTHTHTHVCVCVCMCVFVIVSTCLSIHLTKPQLLHMRTPQNLYFIYLISECHHGYLEPAFHCMYLSSRHTK